MLTQILDNVYSIYVRLPRNPLKNINAYVIKGKEKNLLIDTGFRMDECYQDLTEGLAELGISMDYTDIFLTHHHVDHSGLAKLIATPNTRILMSGLDNHYLRFIYSEAGRRAMADTFIEAGFPSQSSGGIQNAKMWDFGSADLENVDNVFDGEHLNYGGLDLEVIFTPGHTPGHACLYNAEHKLMFLGDHVLFDITPNITSWPGFNDPLGRYIESLQRIAKYDVDIALPAHRKAEGRMVDRVLDIAEHHGTRVREVLEVLDETPGISALEISGRMSWNIRASSWENFPPDQMGFAVSETVAHLEYLLARERVRREYDGGKYLYFNT